jgi:hypothetical protein
VRREWFPKLEDKTMSEILRERIRASAFDKSAGPSAS